MVRTLRYAAVAAVLAAALDAPISLRAQDQAGQAQEPRRPGRAASRQAPTNKLYVVRMLEAPVAGYEGGVQGLTRTKPGRGRRVDTDDGAVAAYAAYLDRRHDEVLARVGGRKIYDYRYVYNGFAAELSARQAEALASQPGVLSVTKDELQTTTTSSTPSFLGLDARGGLWDRLGGVDSAGEDIVVGVIDSGIWPESESFSDRTGAHGNHKKRGKLDYRHLRHWKGICERGERFKRSDCNQKLIGARRFNAAWGGDAGVKAERPWEFASPRDYNGHGSHTAGTAAGNHDVDTDGPAAIFGPVSGIAPRARISVYKALWSTEDGSTASGFNSDLVAAIDQAVADGVDVINYSVSGTSTNFLDATEVSFLFAADAGIFVAASAGNDGPASSTVAHPSPWITTVAAGTHNRDGLGSVTTGSGITYNGASLATAVPFSPLVDAPAAVAAGALAEAARLCFSMSSNGGTPALDPAKVAGKIVVCDRGTNGRTDKSLAVLEAGGVGMILLNTSPNSLNADFHFVPTVHLADTDRAAIKAYAAGPSPTARIAKASLVYDVPAPFTASFSSRGPLLAGGGDVLKPDLMAPGQDILAAVSPAGNHGLDFNLYTGTSMSAPHVAGLAALLKNLHPDWSPMAIKSALMTTGTDVLDGGTPAPNTNPVLIFRQGAGHVLPAKAARPGLVYDSDANDWLAFLCGATTGVDPALCAALSGAGYSLDPSDLNTPSIAIGDLAGVQTVTRRVTNVGRSTATYSAAITGLEGFTTKVTPSTLRIAPGATKTFRVTITRTTAPVNTYGGGQLTWSDGSHTVRSPMVVRPVPLAAPLQVSSAGGPVSYPVTFGYTGPFTATARGLVPAATTAATVGDDPLDDFTPAGAGVVSFPVTIPAGTTYARFSLFDALVSPASDLDVYVYRGATLVALSATAASDEEANLVNPAPGDYTVYVHGFGVPSGAANFTLFSWLLGSADEGNMVVTAPAAAVTGGIGTIGLSFNGLTPGTKYLGSVTYGGVVGLPSPTIVRVDP